MRRFRTRNNLGVSRFPNRIEAAKSRLPYLAAVVEAEGRRFQGDPENGIGTGYSKRNADALIKAAKDAWSAANLAANNGLPVSTAIAAEEGKLLLATQEQQSTLLIGLNRLQEVA